MIFQQSQFSHYRCSSSIGRVFRAIRNGHVRAEILRKPVIEIMCSFVSPRELLNARSYISRVFALHT